MSQQLKTSIESYLTANLLSSAKFLVDRLLTIDKSHDARYLAAQVYFRMGKYRKVMDLCGNIRHLGCVHMYLLGCLEAKEWAKGIEAANMVGIEELGSRDSTLNVGFTLCIAGKLCRKLKKDLDAVKYFSKAIKYDPYCWEALEALSEIGVRVKPEKLYNTRTMMGTMFQQFYTAFWHVCRYNIKAGLQALDSISLKYQDSVWVIIQRAKLLYENVQYEEAIKWFERAQSLDRFETYGLEFYSTSLWHMKRDVDLAYLATKLIAQDRSDPIAWLAMGNSLSLSKDSDSATKCFHRATQLEPSLAYAYTLLGHEYVSLESLSEAQDSYRTALRYDSRHYNAWYGLGMVFLRLGNLPLAEIHFISAQRINPNNSVLLCCIGMVYEKQMEFQKALEMYTKASASHLQSDKYSAYGYNTSSSPSALALYKKAKLLTKFHNYEEALYDLKIVSEMAPNEASVHFLTGQVYRGLGEKSLALKEYTVALNLDPKGAGVVQEAMEELSR